MDSFKAHQNMARMEVLKVAFFWGGGGLLGLGFGQVLGWCFMRGLFLVGIWQMGRLIFESNRGIW